MTDDRLASPWHAGEIAMQASAGAVDRMAMVGQRNIRDHMIAQHRGFYPMLPFVVLGTVDAAGDAWATLRAGEPGFLSAPDPFHLVAAVAVDGADPAESGMADGCAVALLGIDLTTRRRNRLNGTVHRTGPAGFTIAVEQSFGNCPQYIQPRSATLVRPPAQRTAVEAKVSKRLDERALAMVARADTFFVATYADREPGHRHVDVSHRGGSPGFVRIERDGALTIPDYAGNQFFNTLGNIVANPRAGLSFIDFGRGDLLQMTGVAEVISGPVETPLFAGAERLWRFEPTAIVFRADASPLRFALLAPTGSRAS